MTDSAAPAFFLWRLFRQLRSAGFPLGPDDYEAVWLALRAGFGWSSPDALRDLCAALWAKSRQEQAIVAALFEDLGVERWQVPRADAPRVDDVPAPLDPPAPPVPPASIRTAELPQAPPHVQEAPRTGAGLPPISLADRPTVLAPLLLLPQYPVGHRDVVQICRRLRRTVRDGPAVEIDAEATVAARCRRGVAGPVVLVPRRRNAIRLLLLVDSGGSMVPFQPFVESVRDAIVGAAGIHHVSSYYFHNCPVSGADDSVLDELEDDFAPALDPVLSLIAPMDRGTLFSDPSLLSPRPLAAVLDEQPQRLSVLVISDVGAARRRYQLPRVLDTVAFLKHLRAIDARYVLLNPLPPERWAGSTAEHVARHAPMFALDRHGLAQAIDVLQGKRTPLERPL